jgi:adenylate cyclase, class 2
MSFHNSEIKAVCHDADKIRSVLIAEGADYKGLDHQIDTYFNVSRGRLKLREGTIENYLIFYERDERAGVKDSQVELYAVYLWSLIRSERSILSIMLSFI